MSWTYILKTSSSLMKIKNKQYLNGDLNLKQRTRYPLLSRMAIDIYSIPAMSAQSERVFLGPNALVSDFRDRLQSETIEVLKCLKS